MNCLIITMETLLLSVSQIRKGKMDDLGIIFQYNSF